MKPLLVSLRPHQWTKNLLVFAPLALSKHLFEPEPFLRALVAFALFCGLSGTVYLSTTSPTSSATGCIRASGCGPIASGALSARTACVFAGLLGLVVPRRLVRCWAGLRPLRPWPTCC